MNDDDDLKTMIDPMISIGAADGITNIKPNLGDTTISSTGKISIYDGISWLDGNNISTDAILHPIHQEAAQEPALVLEQIADLDQLSLDEYLIKYGEDAELEASTLALNYLNSDSIV